MPENIAADVLQRMDESIQVMRDLTVEVVKVNEKYDSAEANRHKDRRLTFIAIAAAVIAIVAGVGGLFMWDRQSDQADQLAAVVEQSQEDRDLARQANCQYTNSQNERTRQKFVKSNTALGGTLRAAFPQAEDVIATLVANLDATIPSPDVEDRDCNGDVWLTAADYQGNTVPAGLPIGAVLTIDSTTIPDHTGG